VIDPHVPGGEGGGAGSAETPILPPRLLSSLVQGARRGGETRNPPPGRAPHPEQGPRPFPHGDAQPTQEPPPGGPPLTRSLLQPRFPSGIPSYATSCPSIGFATPLPHPFPEPLDTGFVPRQASTASLTHLPARSLQAASGHPGGWPRGPRGVAWAVGRSGGRASCPCSRRMRREDRGKTPWGGPVGEGDRGGHAGEAAAGPFWPLPSPEGTRPLSPGPMAGGSFGVGAPKWPCRPGGAGASASARRRRGKPNLWA
jgi:hypothetical protein